VNPSTSVVPTVFNIVGLFFEIVGAGIAGLGGRQTWREFRPPEALFLAPLTALLDRVTSLLNRLFRHRPAPVTMTLHPAQLTLTAEMLGSASVTRGPLPSITDDPEGFAVAVQERLSSPRDHTERTEGSLIDVRHDAQKAAKEIRSEISDFRADVGRTVQRVTVGGIHLQVVGWTLVVFSVVLQLVAQLVQ
jgi:hypothetical protein